MALPLSNRGEIPILEPFYEALITGAGREGLMWVIVVFK
jgi:hypothetical protein